MKKKHKIIIAVTGASGAIYAKVLFDNKTKNNTDKINLIFFIIIYLL